MTHAQIYRCAAERIFKGQNQYSCIAIAHSAPNSAMLYFEHTPVKRFVDTFDLRNGNLKELHREYRKEARDHRIYMLLLMAEIASDTQRKS